MNPLFIPLIRRFHSLWILAGLMVPMFVNAQVIGTPGYVAPGYLIDSEPTSVIAAEGNFKFNKDPDLPVGAVIPISVSFSLLGPGDVPVVLNDGGFPKGAVTLSLNVNNPAVTDLVPVSIHLRPYTALQPGTIYRVRMQSLLHDGLMVLTEAPGRTYLHFQDTGDPSDLNMVMVAGTPQFDRNYVMDTLTTADRNKLAISVPYTIYRHDPVGVSQTTTAEFEISIKDSLGNVVVGPQTLLAETVDVDHWNAQGVPASKADSASFVFLPKTQLDPVNQEYSVEVRVANYDSPPPSPKIREGNVAESAKQRILHFNGKLLMGSVEASVANITNVPSETSVVGGSVQSSLTIPHLAASFLGGNYTFGNGSAMAVNLMPNGDAVYTGAGTFAVATAADGSGTVAGVSYHIPPGSLSVSSAGASASSLTVKLPHGVGIGANSGQRLLDNTLVSGAVALNGTLQPVGMVGFGSNGWFNEESKPLMIRYTAVSWNTGTGVFTFTTEDAVFVRLAATEILEGEAANVVNPNACVRASNDHYYRAASHLTASVAQISASASGDGLLKAVLNFSALGDSEFFPHFPYAPTTVPAASLTFDGGQADIVADRMVPGTSFLHGVAQFRVFYDSSCSYADDVGGCPTMITPTFRQMEFEPSVTIGAQSNTLRFTRDGGLHGPGVIFGGNPELRWGKKPLGGQDDYAQRHTGAFATGAYHMPGTFISGGVAQDDPNQIEANTFGAASPADAAAAILLAGAIPHSEAINLVERPRTAIAKAGLYDYGYAIGNGDYSGLNFRVSQHAIQAISKIGDKFSDPYDLAAVSKYYVRYSGVSGRHQADDYGPNLEIYEYQFDLERYALTFLSNVNIGSMTDGEIAIPFPADIVFEFESMTFTCTGEIRDAQVPQSLLSTPKILGPDYWQADLYPLAYIFAADDPCVDKPTFGVTSRVFCSPMPGSSLIGHLGFKPGGQLMRALDGHSKLQSRFAVPGKTKIQGPPGGGDYEFLCGAFAFFNDHASNPWIPDPYVNHGFLNITGHMKVPYFGRTYITAHTKARENAPGPQIYYVMRRHIAPHVHMTLQDDGHMGHPAITNPRNFRLGGAGAKDSNPDFLAFARAPFLGDPNFWDFDFKWNRDLWSFKSVEKGVTIVLVNTKAKVTSLTPAAAKLVFGFSAGMEKLTITDIVAKSGVFTQFAGALSESFTPAKIDKFAGSIAGADRFIDSNLDPLANDIISALNTPSPALLRNLLDGREGADMDALAAEFVPLSENLSAIVANGWGERYAEKVSDYYDTVAEAGPILTGLTTKDTFVKTAKSFIKRNYSGFSALIASGLLEGYFDEKPLSMLFGLNKVAAEVVPAVNAYRDNLLNEDSGAAAQIAASLSAETLESSLKQNLVEQFLDFAVSQPDGSIRLELANLSDDELTARVNAAIRTTALSSAAVSSMRATSTMYVEPITSYTRATFNGVSGVMNDEIAEMISKHLTPIDDLIKSAVGEIGKKVGYGSLKGSAETTGDALRELKLDGAFKLGIGSGIGFNGSFVIKQINTKSKTGFCNPVDGVLAYDMRITGNDIGGDWIMGGYTADVSIILIPEVSADPSVKGFMIRGAGGSLVLKSKSTFQGFGLEKIGFACVMSTRYDNYIAAVTSLAFKGFSLGGGLYAGQSCSLAPILMVDPDFDPKFGQAPYSGFYLFGSGRKSLPMWSVLESFQSDGSGIVDIENAIIDDILSCFLRLSVGARVGYYVFDSSENGSGLRYGGDLTGEVLCAIKVKGAIDIFGGKGKAKLEAKVGKCPFCLKFKKEMKASVSSKGVKLK